MVSQSKRSREQWEGGREREEAKEGRDGGKMSGQEYMKRSEYKNIRT